MSSEHQHPAVDLDGLAAQVRSRVGGEEGDDARDLYGRADTAEGYAADVSLHRLGRREALVVGRVDDAGRDGVDAHAVGRKLLGEALRHSDEPALRRRIMYRPE